MRPAMTLGEQWLSVDLKQSVPTKIGRLVRAEFEGFHLRVVIALILLAPLPIHVGGRLRGIILRLAGFQIGRGAIFAGTPIIALADNHYKNLLIGEGCWFNIACLFDLGAQIRIGNKVSMGHGVLILTRSHEVGTSEQRALTLLVKPVNIGSGVWLGSRSTFLPRVPISDDAILAHGLGVYPGVPPLPLRPHPPAP